MSNLQKLKEVVQILGLDPEWIVLKIKGTNKRIEIAENVFKLGTNSVTLEQLQRTLKSLEAKAIKIQTLAMKRQEDGGQFMEDILDALQDKAKPYYTKPTIAELHSLRINNAFAWGAPKRWIISKPGKGSWWKVNIVEQHGETKKFRLATLTLKYNLRRGYVRSLTSWYIAKNFLVKAAEKFPPLTAILADPN